MTTYIPRREFLSIGSDRGDAHRRAPDGAGDRARPLAGAGRPVVWSTVALLLVGGLGSYWFHQRSSGQYFDFKLLAYLGPLAVATAAVGASRVPVVGWVALAAFGLTAFHGADSSSPRRATSSRRTCVPSRG